MTRAREPLGWRDCALNFGQSTFGSRIKMRNGVRKPICVRSPPGDTFLPWRIDQKMQRGGMGKMRFLDGGIPNSSSGNSARRVDVSPRKPETTSLPHAAQHDLSASGRKIGPEDSGKGRQRVGIKKLLDPQNGSDGKPIASPLPHLMRAVAAADPTGTTGSALVTAMLDARPMGMAGLLNSLKSMWTGSSPAVSAQTHLHQFRDVAGKLGIGEKTHDGHLLSFP